ncbi:MAG: hypothetical protein HKN29_16650 [Rhodothermales bacterium]|nr:hypothetical protein [Rhodothermales bacterium]
MSRLITVSTSVASADQRRGRAGRLGPGTCYRLWTRVDHAARKPFDEPEILQADLASMVLELAVWGTREPSALRWLDSPPDPAVESARELLMQLGALTPGGPTPQGRKMNRLGMHPRLAHLVNEGARRGLTDLAVRLAALLEEKDVLRGYPSELPTDLRLRVELLSDGSRRSVLGAVVDGGAVRRVRKRAGEIGRRVGATTGPDRKGPGAAHGRRSGSQAGGKAGMDPAAVEHTGVLLAAAYPDRLAQRIRDGHFRLRNGRPVTIPENDPLASEPFLAVATVGGGQDRHRAFLAAPISAEEIEEAFQADITTADHVYWDEASERVHSVRRRALDSVVLAEAPLSKPDPAATARVLLEVLRNRGAQLLPWDRKTRQLQDRLAFLHRREDSRFPDRSDDGLLGGELLLPYLSGMTRLSDLRRLDLHEILLSDLDWPMRQELDMQAPTHLTVPSGSRVPLDYSDPESVVLAVRLQEVFGLTETPRVAGEPVTMRLLSPAQRPVQITQDLAGFWATSYFDVRKDLRGRYPKHYWPENPLDATPTAGAKPRKR